MTPEVETRFVVADKVWVATALLHQRFPNRPDFTRAEILETLTSEGLADGVKASTLEASIRQHCVSDYAPSDNHNERMLFQTRPDYRRLFCPGDLTHPGRVRRGKLPKSLPMRGQIPSKYWDLLDWYSQWSKEHHAPGPFSSWEDDPLIRLIGSGRDIWADEHADDYVKRLRDESQ